MLSSVTLRNLKIIDETDDYVVVDKPPFLLTHPTKPNGAPTLWKELRELLAFEIANGSQVSIVNRLDRETSGLVLVAKTAAAARRCGMLMQRRRLKKEYLAIVWGWPEWEVKVVDAPLDRQGKHQESAIWLKQMIHRAGASAQTDFRIERRFIKLGSSGENKFSLIRAVPGTGRTIRFVCMWLRLAIRLWAIKFMDPTSSFISGSSKPAGRLNLSANCYCRGTRFIQQSWRSTVKWNGIVRCLSILRIFLPTHKCCSRTSFRRSQSAATELSNLG
jgi:RNA pseudouridylate synthase